MKYVKVVKLTDKNVWYSIGKIYHITGSEDETYYRHSPIHLIRKEDTIQSTKKRISKTMEQND